MGCTVASSPNRARIPLPGRWKPSSEVTPVLRKLMPISLAFLAGALLVGGFLSGALPPLGLAVIAVAALLWRLFRPGSTSSLFADSLLVVFGLALSTVSVAGLMLMAHYEGLRNLATPCYDLSELEKHDGRISSFSKIRLAGGVFIDLKARRHTRDYGWVVPIYSRTHPSFPGHRGPSTPPSFFLALTAPRLQIFSYFSPPAESEVRYDLYVRQGRSGFLMEEPSDLLVQPNLESSEWVALTGSALFSLGLCLLISNLGAQSRGRRPSRWERPL